MSTRRQPPLLIRRLILSFKAWFRALSKLVKQSIFWCLHFISQTLIPQKQPAKKRRPANKKKPILHAGFVLPTTIMVLLIVGLFTGAIIVRTGERSQDVVSSRESQRIENVATPAVDRAKAKLENIFNRDPRFPVGVPSENVLRDMMRYIESENANLGGFESDPYTLPDETRLDLDGDGTQDNAWRYETDLDGDGTNEVVAYSVMMNTGLDNDCDGTIQRVDNDNSDDFPFNEDDNILYNTSQGENECQNKGRNINEEDYGFWSSPSVKADNLLTKTGPLSIQATEGTTAECEIEGLEDENGWFAADATSVRKNFQVNVFVQNQNEANKAVTALEFQQDRQLDRGNKFGVWFRYDLLIHPGPPFRLNGAIHTDGNIITYNDSLRFYLVSSPKSCIYTEDANTITLTQEEDSNGTILYQAQAISVDGDTEEIDLFGEDGPSATGVDFAPDNDSIQASINNRDFYDYTLDPLVLYTEDRLVSRGKQNNDGSYDVDGVRDTTWGNRAGNDPSDRMRNDIQRKPYVDDLYRADDRWGPKPKYGPDKKYTIAELVDSSGTPVGYEKNGDLIKADDADDLNPETLIGLNPPEKYPQEVGLDGYWERRAYVQGLRVIVGQRLEIGNPFGWVIDGNGDGDYGDAGDKGRGDDPINPADPSFVPPDDPSGSLLTLLGINSNQVSGMDDRKNEYRQQRTLRDNLASVQATAIYHYNDDDDEGEGDFPVATIATTAHPGTLETIANSTTFTDHPSTGDLQTNFLEGIGTNGWEFNAPGNVTTESAFAALMDDSNSDLRKALTNLAYMSGDPFGAFPPTQDSDDADDTNEAVPEVGPVVHPYPQLTMWGDHSHLRRAIQQLEDGTNYDDISLADRTTLQTAAATLGMLAYNIDWVQEVYDNDLAEVETVLGNLSNGAWTSVGTQLANVIGANNINNGNPIIGRDGAVCTSTGTGVVNGNGCPTQNPNDVGDPNDPEHYSTYFSQFSLEDWLTFVEDGGVDAGAADEIRDVLEAYRDNLVNNPIARLALTIQRDREKGFILATPGVDTENFDSATGNYTIPNSGSGAVNSGNINPGNVYQIGCDPTSDRYGLSFVNSDKAKLGLASIVCNSLVNPEVKYPSLYYLFPLNDHYHDGTHNGNPRDRQPDRDYNNDGDTDDVINEQDFNGNGEVDAVEDFNRNGQFDNGLAEANDGPASDEPYISDHYIFERSSDDPTTGTGVNWGLVYQAVDPADIALTPRTRDNWVLPYTTDTPTAASGDNLTDAAINSISDNGTTIYVPFLDKGMFNGRQLMMARVLNIDLGILRDNDSINSDISVTNDNINGESWLPNSGLVYAFREDAVREDGIARPRVNNWTQCNTETTLTGTTECQFDVTVPRDPPKQGSNGVSPKPVDFAADPDRRPNGFRLSNGSELGRKGTTRGMSFITDNPAYLLGDFNLHSKEEFTEDLNTNNWNNFYTRTTLDTGFARSNPNDPNDFDVDKWRPTEVIADAITILSNVYCDGTIEGGIRRNNNSRVSGCSGSTESFHNTTFYGDNDFPWILEDGNTSPSGTNNPSPAPILVSKNGEISNTTNGTHDVYLKLNQARPLNRADAQTTANLVFISGLSPTRDNETYGGLHNFPRFNEDWSTNLNITGSIIQLNFSTYDSANLDQQDTFQPIGNANGGSYFRFYSPPGRRWGYDPALQYNPPGPIVERLLSQSGLRSEIYQEIEVGDPYVQQLCRAVTNNSDTCPEP